MLLAVSSTGSYLVGLDQATRGVVIGGGVACHGLVDAVGWALLVSNSQCQSRSRYME
jgi:hypothetical protein